MDGYYQIHHGCATVVRHSKLTMQWPAPWKDTPPYANQRHDGTIAHWSMPKRGHRTSPSTLTGESFRLASTNINDGARSFWTDTFFDVKRTYGQRILEIEHGPRWWCQPPEAWVEKHRLFTKDKLAQKKEMRASWLSCIRVLGEVDPQRTTQSNTCMFSQFTIYDYCSSKKSSLDPRLTVRRTTSAKFSRGALIFALYGILYAVSSLDLRWRSCPEACVWTVEHAQ